MFNRAKRQITKHFNLDVTKFQFDDDLQELYHPDLFYNLCFDETMLLIGHYKFIPGVMYRSDGSGEPDEYDYIEDCVFGRNQYDDAIKTFIEMEEKYRESCEAENELIIRGEQPWMIYILF